MWRCTGRSAAFAAEASAAKAAERPVHLHIATPPGPPPADGELAARLKSAIQSGAELKLLQSLRDGDKLSLWAALQAAAPAKEQGDLGGNA